MNITMRKLAMLEKVMNEREMEAKFEGFTTCPVNSELKHQITALMDKVRAIQAGVILKSGFICYNTLDMEGILWQIRF